VSPEEIALLRTSLVEVRAVGPKAAEAFYAELFRLDPATQVLFRSPIGEQAVTFFHELDAVLSAVENLPDFVARARRLGRMHTGRGVRPEHFRTAATALDAMLRAVYGPELTQELSTAWRRAYQLAAQVMQETLYGA
jgi:hemoglobin-like flavoprotein